MTAVPPPVFPGFRHIPVDELLQLLQKQQELRAFPQPQPIALDDTAKRPFVIPPPAKATLPPQPQQAAAQPVPPPPHLLPQQPVAVPHQVIARASPAQRFVTSPVEAAALKPAQNMPPPRPHTISPQRVTALTPQPVVSPAHLNSYVKMLELSSMQMAHIQQQQQAAHHQHQQQVQQRGAAMRRHSASAAQHAQHVQNLSMRRASQLPPPPHLTPMRPMKEPSKIVEYPPLPALPALPVLPPLPAALPMLPHPMSAFPLPIELQELSRQCLSFGGLDDPRYQHFLHNIRLAYANMNNMLQASAIPANPSP